MAKAITALSGEDDEKHLSIIAMLLDDYHRQMLNENRFPKSSVMDFRPPRKPSQRASFKRRKPQGRKTVKTQGK